MKKILLSLMTLVLVIGLVGAGAFAWFSDTEVSTGNTFTAGTLDMEIADNNEGFRSGTPVTASWTSPAGWAPGETIETGIIRLKNVGSIDINYLMTTFHNYSINYTGTPADLGNVIEVVGYWEFVPGVGWFNNIGTPQSLETQIGNQDGTLTLRELVDAWWFGDGTWIDYATGMSYDAGTDGPAIPVGETYQVKLVLKLMGPEATNAYQGASVSFDIDFEGIQNLDDQKH